MDLADALRSLFLEQNTSADFVFLLLLLALRLVYPV